MNGKGKNVSKSQNPCASTGTASDNARRRRLTSDKWHKWTQWRLVLDAEAAWVLTRKWVLPLPGPARTSSGLFNLAGSKSKGYSNRFSIKWEKLIRPCPFVCVVLFLNSERRNQHTMNHNASINTRKGDGSLIASRCSRDSDDKSSLHGVLGPVTHSMILQFSIGGLIWFRHVSCTAQCIKLRQGLILHQLLSGEKLWANEPMAMTQFWSWQRTWLRILDILQSGHVQYLQIGLWPLAPSLLFMSLFHSAWLICLSA